MLVAVQGKRRQLMNYYQHLIETQNRQRDAQHAREQRLLIAEARLTQPSRRGFRLPRLLSFSLPRRPATASAAVPDLPGICLNC